MVVAADDHVGMLGGWNGRKVGLRGLCGEPSPLSRSLGFFLADITDRKLCARCNVTEPGFSGSTFGSTLVKCTQSHHRMIVKTVKGTDIAAKSQALSEIFIFPSEPVWTNWVEKKFSLEVS